jgi:hypothetical protein
MKRSRARPRSGKGASKTTKQPVVEGHLGFVDLNFKVNPNFHQRFRVEAGYARLPLKKLMIESFEAWLKVRGKVLEEDERDRSSKRRRDSDGDNAVAQRPSRRRKRDQGVS